MNAPAYKHMLRSYTLTVLKIGLEIELVRPTDHDSIISITVDPDGK